MMIYSSNSTLNDYFTQGQKFSVLILQDGLWIDFFFLFLSLSFFFFKKK